MKRLWQHLAVALILCLPHLASAQQTAASHAEMIQDRIRACMQANGYDRAQCTTLVTDAELREAAFRSREAQRGAPFTNEVPTTDVSDPLGPAKLAVPKRATKPQDQPPPPNPLVTSYKATMSGQGIDRVPENDQDFTDRVGWLLALMDGTYADPGDVGSEVIALLDISRMTPGFESEKPSFIKEYYLIGCGPKVDLSDRAAVARAMEDGSLAKGVPHTQVDGQQLLLFDAHKGLQYDRCQFNVLLTYRFVGYKPGQKSGQVPKIEQGYRIMDLPLEWEPTQIVENGKALPNTGWDFSGRRAYTLNPEPKSLIVPVIAPVPVPLSQPCTDCIWYSLEFGTPRRPPAPDNAEPTVH